MSHSARQMTARFACLACPPTAVDAAEPWGDSVSRLTPAFLRGYSSEQPKRALHAGAQPSRCFWPMGLPAVRFCSDLREKTPVQAFRLDHDAAHTTTRH